MVTTAGRSSVCSWVVCSAAFSMTTASSAVLWPAMLPGSTSDATLAKEDVMPMSKFTAKKNKKQQQVGGSAEDKL